MKNIVLFIVGPTASGKSDLAYRLAASLKTEIISADSMQIYRGMDIGTAKVSKEERNLIPHHMIDICDPSENFTVYHFREQALQAIESISKKKKIPVVAGGTGLYVRALLEGLSDQPGENAEIRNKLEAELKENGVAFMYERLLKVDPRAVERIHSGHERRIIRALEIFETTGRSASDWYEEKTPLTKLGYQPLVYGLRMEKEVLHKRIDARVENMFESGLLEEIEGLLRKPLSKTALQAVGYKEVLPYFESGDISIDEVKELIKKNTRLLAKRQMTWFKKEKNLIWLDVSDAVDIENYAKKILEDISR